MINTTINQIKARKLFHRSYYRRGLNILIGLLVLELLLTGLSFVTVRDRIVPAFYASSSDGILTQLKARPQPNRSNKFLLD